MVKLTFFLFFHLVSGRKKFLHLKRTSFLVSVTRFNIFYQIICSGDKKSKKKKKNGGICFSGLANQKVRNNFFFSIFSTRFMSKYSKSRSLFIFTIYFVKISKNSDSHNYLNALVLKNQ
jgi:hypothetical protein